MRKTLSFALLLVLCTSGWAASFSGTLTPTSNLAWSGSVTGVISNMNLITTPLCDSTICDVYTLTVNIASTYWLANPNNAIHVKLAWTGTIPNSDIDIYVLDSSGNVACAGTSSNPVGEDADCGQLANGTYTVNIAPATAVNQSYNGSITFAPEPASTIQNTGLARYRKGNFTFTSPVELVRPNNLTSNTNGNGFVTFLDGDAEPRVVHDGVGNLYVSAIQGVPAGTDFYKSMDSGQTWTYLGEPDGAQAANVLAGTNGAGAGGGDEDEIVLPNGQIVMTSLWLGSNTTCTSSTGGTAWVCNPNGSTVPADDRQWLANYGNNIVYITSKQIGAVLTGPESIYVAKSTDGGQTFPTVSFVTTPELGLQPGDQGNIIVDKNGNVYTVFFDQSGSTLYVAKSVDGGSTWMIKQAFQNPPCSPTLCISMVHVFPAIAADNANNLYVVFSDGTYSYLTRSTDGGVSWSLPAIVSSLYGVKSSVEPWIVAGDAGKINIFYYGTNSTNFMANDCTAATRNDPTQCALWVVYMAQSLNATSKVPTFTVAPATPYVVHAGAICNNGTGCPQGTRTMLEYFFPDTGLDGSAMAVYPDSEHILDATSTNTNVWFVKQTGGSKITGQ